MILKIEHDICIICFLSSAGKDADGVLFKNLTPVQRARVFNAIAKEFSSYRSTLVTLLLGNEVNRMLNTKWTTSVVGGGREHDALLDGLMMWFEQTECPTGRELYDALTDAGCPEDLLQKYKTPFKVCQTALTVRLDGCVLQNSFLWCMWSVQRHRPM